MNRLHRKIQRAFSFKHREHWASAYDFCGDTVIDAVSHISTRSGQSLNKPHCGRAFDQTTYNACSNRGERSVVTARQENAVRPRPEGIPSISRCERFYVRVQFRTHPRLTAAYRAVTSSKARNVRYTHYSFLVFGFGGFRSDAGYTSRPTNRCCTHSKSESGTPQRVVVVYGVRTRETLERPVQLAIRIDAVGLAGLCGIPRYAESNRKFTLEA